MAKVTSKLQLTVPKAIADRYGIRPGDELEWLPAGDAIRVIPSGSRRGVQQAGTVEQRLRLFDQATERQRNRESVREKTDVVKELSEHPVKPHETERGWRREDLYDRGRTR